jgi:predicted nucleotidyltransferase
MRPEIKPILAELKREFAAIYGDRLVKLVLFGSHARGEATAESDIDVLVVLKGPVDDWEERQRTSEANAALCLDHDVLTQRVFEPAGWLESGATSLARNIRREGVTV